MEFLKEGLLSVNPGLMVWTVITFLILVLILAKAAWKPIVSSLDKRAEKVRGDIDKADQARKDAEELLVQHKELINQANCDAEKIIAHSKEEAEKVRQEIIDKANQDADLMVARATKQIQVAQESALQDLKKEIAEVSVEIAEKVAVKSISPADQMDLINKSIENLDKIQ